VSTAIATRTEMCVCALELRPSDEIVELGWIPLTVVSVRVYEAQGFVTADYESTAGPGSRTLALTTRVCIVRTEEEGH
jgi:hypothetical protein